LGKYSAMSQFIAIILLIYSIAMIANTEEAQDANNIVDADTIADSMTSLQLFLKGFGKYLPEEVRILLEQITSEDMKTIESIDYATVISEEEFIIELDKKNPILAQKMRAVNATIFAKIEALPSAARQYMLKSIESLKGLGKDASDPAIKSLKAIIDEYDALSEDDQRAIVESFPCIGEIMKSDSFKTWLDETAEITIK
uniref:Fatty-acid and retinol-binding protein 1 n=1 Tax=Parascaris univalens TaxID=6257 RepID=A0A915AVH5_PARUN